MKKIFVIFAFLLSAFTAFADGLSANDVTLKNDETANLEINLDNASSDIIVGLQFNINLSAGITPVMEGDKVVITPSNRLNGSYSLRGKKMADGSYLFTFLSNERTPIEGNSGTLFSITLQNSASLADGTYRAVISDVTITDLNGYEQMAANAESCITVVHSYKLTYYVDGAKYKEISYDFGDAIPPEQEPTKEGYTFSGWSEIPATLPAHDVEVNGSFTINMYTIKFVNEDGTVLQSSEAEYGAIPVYSGSTPTKASTAEYSYTFAGWTPEIVAAKADATYTATYTSTSNQYTLTYKVDGDVYKEYTLNYGDAITPEAEPTKERHTFSGWSEIPATMPAHDVEVTGTFEINVADVLAPVVEEGTDITEENAEDITEFKLTLNEVETIEVNEDASAELLIDGVLSGTASKDDISVSDGVITIKFNYIDNEENAPDKTKAFRKSVARAAEDEVSVEVIIAAGSFNINGENVTENISYSYTAPASVAEEIEENLSSVIHGIAADEYSSKVYNLKGIRVSKNQKGIVIKNGKTFFVK